MLVIFSVNSIPVRLTLERWEHIINRHPEMLTEKEKVVETIKSPEYVQQGDYGTLMAVKFYSKTPLTSKHLIAVYKETDRTDGFVLTSYFTNKPDAKRKTLWKK